MAKQPVYMTSKTANVMIDIWAAAEKVPAGVPVPVPNAKEATELERLGLIERHHLGKGTGAVVTKMGAQFVRDAMRTLGN